jgi:signal transduction histidine kinase
MIRVVFDGETEPPESLPTRRSNTQVFIIYRLMYRSLTTLWILLVPFTAMAQHEKADSLRSHINPAIMEPGTVSSISELSELLIRGSEYDEAKQWLLLGYEVADKISDDEGKFTILTLLAEQYLQQDRPDSALAMTEQAWILASTPDQNEKLRELDGDASALSGRYVLAMEQYNRAAFLADSLGNRGREAELIFKSAGAWSALGDHTEALKGYYHGLEYAELAGDSVFTATASNLVGSEFLDLSNYEQAEYFLLKAEKIARAVDLTDVLQSALLNLANLYRDTSDFEEAETYYAQALELSEARETTINRARLFYNLGTMEQKRGNAGEAERLLLYALELSREQNDVETEYYTATALGGFEMERNNNVQAIRWYARANHAVEEKNYESLRLSSYDNLYKAYRETGNFSESLRWLEQRDRMKDSLNTDEKSRLLAEYETLFNMKQNREQTEALRAREQEAQAMLILQQWLIGLSLLVGVVLTVASVILIKTNKKRKRVNEELETSNRRLHQMNSTVQEQNDELEQVNEIKNKLFAIIAHDLRGPLSSLQSLIYLVREHDLSQDEMAEITKTLERNLQENASMMDNLLAWAQAQMNGIKLNVRDFTLIQGIKSVTDQIQFQAEEKGIQIKMDVDSTIEVKADYDMVKLVVRNLVANAVKFSEMGDAILLKAFYSKSEGMAEVHVIDEGTGIGIEDQSKLFSKGHFTKRGTDNEKGSGLGLMLCKEFIEGHGGSLWFESKPGEGTTFMFTVPLAVSSNRDTPDFSRTVNPIDIGKKKKPALESSH